MPNPVKPNIRIAGPLLDRHYALLGRVVSAWTQVELRIAYTVGVITGAKVRSILFAFENMQTRGKLDTATAVIAAEGDLRWPGIRDELIPILTDAKKWSSVRHAAAHAYWIGLSARGGMIAFDVEARGQSPQVGRVSWMEAEFETAIHRLNDLALKMKEVTDDIRWETGTDPDFS